MTSARPSEKATWHYSTAAARWYALGRYYAMFPRDFLHDAISHLTEPNDHVLDPFCGRGNAPFVATVLGRRALAIDINPIAWLFAAAKQQPAKAPARLLARLREVGHARRPADRRSNSRFETMAWAPQVRAFLKAARRELDWETSIVDRTLMAFIALHMQDKRDTGLSNTLSPTIAHSPTYAIKWWTHHGLLAPPDVDPVRMLENKITRRYRYGVPDQAPSRVLLGDARTELPQRRSSDARLLITSPPYCGVTDYWNDHWIRLWLLGHDLRKDWSKTAKYTNQENYRELITAVLRHSRKHLRDDATILIRSDQRRRTAEMCSQAITEVWPDRTLMQLPSSASHAGTSNGHGRGGTKSKEIDFLIPGSGATQWARERNFQPAPVTTA
ncbi:DNA methyltransferase [Candidatus Poriferisodalis sp.]|uniref:DNA methyltransferase n=1 Tax=Candidatus Poriferisodalis sp. TaxID=3101277 RepID=UPI003B5A661B